MKVFIDPAYDMVKACIEKARHQATDSKRNGICVDHPSDNTRNISSDVL